jgi:hypothetical protein
MTTFDPSKAALLHEIANDAVIEWNPEHADLWPNAAHLFDAWGEVEPGAVHPTPLPDDETLLPYGP